MPWFPNSVTWLTEWSGAATDADCLGQGLDPQDQAQGLDIRGQGLYS